MKKIILFFIAFPLIYINFFSEKAYLDREVKRLCAIDGGITVYETVKLPAERFEKDGSLYIPPERLAKLKDEFYYESSQVLLRKGNPELRRYHFKIYRRSDKKIFGESTSYSRVGGDMPGSWHHTWFRCPNDADIVDLNMQVFIKK